MLAIPVHGETCNAAFYLPAASNANFRLPTFKSHRWLRQGKPCCPAWLLPKRQNIFWLYLILTNVKVEAISPCLKVQLDFSVVRVLCCMLFDGRIINSDDFCRQRSSRRSASGAPKKEDDAKPISYYLENFQ